MTDARSAQTEATESDLELERVLATGESRATVRRFGDRRADALHDAETSTADLDGDGVLSKAEFPKYTAAFWFDAVDLDHSGSLNRDEWAYYRAALDSENGMLAIRLGGSGDMSDTAIRWKYQRTVPQLPSPLLYGGVLYMVNDNGIDPDDFTQRSDRADVKEKLKATTESAVARGVFGSPTIFVNGEMFFGQDRLDFVEEMLLP